MSSDDYTPRVEPGFRPAGAGHTVAMRCGICSQPMRNYGRRLLMHRGAKVWACKACQAARATT